MKNKREILFTCAKDRLSLYEVNEKLRQNGLPSVTDNEYVMWQQSIAPILQSNMIYYNDFVVTGSLTLSGLVHLINDRISNKVVS